MQRFQPYLFQPIESRLSFSLNEVLEEARAAFFPEIETRVEVRIAGQPALASIHLHLMGQDHHVVVFHPILNRPDTPIQVVRFIAKHELTHIVRPGRVVRGEYESHPPEFWRHEYFVGPERWAVWHWLHTNLRRLARNTRWGFRVFRTWRMDAAAFRPYTPGLPLNYERWAHAAPDDGQLLLPPDWAPRPLLATEPPSTPGATIAHHLAREFRNAHRHHAPDWHANRHA